MSEEQDARIALLHECGSNSRNWYNVLVGLAIVLFTVVQVRDQLPISLWWSCIFAVAWQAAYAIIRAATSVKLSQSVLKVGAPPHVAYKTYVQELNDKVNNELRGDPCWKYGAYLGDWLGWILWTIAGCAPALIALIDVVSHPVWCFCV